MLQLKGIKKNYLAGDSEVQALKGIDVSFRKSEFVAVLGPSGCGKTTLLNIVGGLDRYTDGDLVIQGKSTKEYKDRDWDHYRNHTIGFVFQTYNLIPHQTVLANVELALTLSGVSKSERRERAKKMLERVGLGDQLNKKPNQMSGGQMQRVAIARALINNPEILLADEPTGALDTETSVQIMDLLKEIAKDRLVIMVTHNPDLAEQYATRILRFLDGKMLSDSDPYTEKQLEEDRKKAEKAAKKAEKDEKKKSKKEKHVSMSLLTAGSLSLNNLMTKKGRTLLTSFAGSIGIIGIALILSLSDGFQSYINDVQENTLSSYPLTIQQQAADLSSLMENLSNTTKDEEEYTLDKVYISDTASEMMNAMVSEVKENDMTSLKKYLESEENKEKLKDYNIEYVYNITPQVYLADTSEDIVTVNPNPMVDAYYQMLGYDMSSASSSYASMLSMGTSMMDVWTLMYGDQKLLDEQYDVIAGAWPQNKNEVVLVVDERNNITDLTMYGLGLRDANEISAAFEKIMKGEKLESQADSFTYEELMNLQFRLLLNTDIYEYDENLGCWADRAKNDEYMAEKIENGLPIHISGIVREKAGVTQGALMRGTICYTQELVDYLIENNSKSEIVKAQQDDPDKDVFTGYPFEDYEDVTIDDVYAYIDSMTPAELVQLQGMFRSFYGESFDGSDVTSALASMSDEELVAAVAPMMLQETTAEEAKLFAATEQGKMAMMAAVAQSAGVEPNPALLDNLTDEQMLETYKGILMSQMTADAIRQKIAAMTPEEQAALAGAFNPTDAESVKAMLQTMDQDQLLKIFKDQLLAQSTANTYDGNLQMMGMRDPDKPFSIMIYSPSFDAKEDFETLLDDYNKMQEDSGNKDSVIEYTDYIGILLSGVTKIINMVSYVLIGFVSISLVVSSIMIGIITYISVLERTKEIGILRSIGASKRDVSHVFNAETFLVGLVAGVIGIVITKLLDIPINMIIEHVSGVPDVAFLRPIYALILIAISVILTLIAGIIPSRLAAKKDPVIALRTE